MLIKHIVCSTSDLQTNDVKWIYALGFRIPYILMHRWSKFDCMVNLTRTNLFYVVYIFRNIPSCQAISVKAWVCDSGNVDDNPMFLSHSESSIFHESVMQNSHLNNVV